MKSYSADYRNTDGRSPTNIWLLRNPLDFIAEDHLRLRTMCAKIDNLARGQIVNQRAVTEILHYIRQEMLVLLADEDDDLLPRVMARAKPEDELPKLARRLHQEHSDIARHLDKVIRGLEALRPSQDLPDALCRALSNLANATRRHLILENAVLLPLSRARLTDTDLRSLRAAMLERRGLQNFFPD